MPIVNDNLGMKCSRAEEDEDEPQIMARLMAKYGRLPSFPFICFSSDPLKKDDVLPEPLVSLPPVVIPDGKVWSSSVQEENQRHLPSVSQRGFVVPIGGLFTEDITPYTPKLMPMSEPSAAFLYEVKPQEGVLDEPPMAQLVVPAGKFQGRDQTFNKPVLNVCADLSTSLGDGAAPPVSTLQASMDLPLSPRTPNHPVRERKPIQSGLTKLLRQASEKKEEKMPAPS